MRGLAIDFGEGWIDSGEFGNEVVAVICDQGFPQEKITEMLLTCPWEEVVWVIRDSDRTARAAFEAADMPYLCIPLNPFYKVVNPGDSVSIEFKETTLDDGTVHQTALKKPKVTYPDSQVLFDGRGAKRECEFMYGCTHVLVFRNLSSAVSAHWAGRASPRAKVNIIEHGKAKRKGRA